MFPAVSERRAWFVYDIPTWVTNVEFVQVGFDLQRPHCFGLGSQALGEEQILFVPVRTSVEELTRGGAGRDDTFEDLRDGVPYAAIPFSPGYSSGMVSCWGDDSSTEFQYGARLTDEFLAQAKARPGGTIAIGVALTTLDGIAGNGEAILLQPWLQWTMFSERAPVFIQEPVSQHLGSVGWTWLSATACGADPFASFWLKDRAYYTNVSFIRVSSNDLGRFQYVATNSWGMATSQVAQVDAPLLYWGGVPEDQEFSTGEDVVLYAYAVASGASIPPTWYFHPVSATDDTPIELDQTTALYRRAEPFSTALLGSYFAVASHAFGSITSPVARVTLRDQAPYLVTPPRGKLVVRNGDSVGISAEARGTRPITYQWFHHDRLLPLATNSSLRIERMTDPQLGRYSVVMSNAFGVTSNLMVEWVVAAEHPMPLLDWPRSQEILEGNPTGLAASFSFKGMSQVRWFRDGQLILDHEVGNGSPYFPGEQTTYLNLDGRFSETGNYSMTLSNAVGSVTSPPARITIKGQAPRIQQDLTNIAAYLSSDATFSFPVSAGPLATYFWFFNQALLRTNSGRDLRFPVRTTAVAGDYFVVASNKYGSVTSRVAKLEVLTAPPIFLSQTYGVRVGIGNPFSFEVSAWGAPTPTLQWYRNGQPLARSTGSKLEVAAAGPSDVGDYTVFARNASGMATSAVISLVLTGVPPRIELQVMDRLWHPGNTLRLSGKFDGIPSPTIFYQKEGGVELPGWEGGGLISTNARVRDSGLYRLISRNYFGAATSSWVRLEVISRGPLDSLELRSGFAGNDHPHRVWWAKDRFFGRGKQGSLISSVDAERWDFLMNGERKFGGNIVHANGRYLTVEGSEVSLSSDGVRWERFPLPGRGGNALVLRDRFIVPDLAGLYQQQSGKLYSSVDGIHWQTHSVSLAYDGLLSGPWVAGDRLWLWPAGSIPSSGKMEGFVSSDGVSWSRFGVDFSSPSDKWPFVAVEQRGDRLIAVDPGIVWVGSLDGKTWLKVFDRSQEGSFHQAVIGLDRIVTDEPGLVIGFDGVPFPEPATPGLEVTPLAYGGGRFVAQAPYESLAYSDDGFHWFLAPQLRNTELWGAAAHGDQLRIVSPDGIQDLSVDGTITPLTDPVAGRSYNKIIHDGIRWIAVGDQGAVALSIDGWNWEDRSVGESVDLNSVASGNGLILAIGDSGRVFRSADLRTWTIERSGVGVSDPDPSALGRFLDFNDIAFGNGLFVAVGGRYNPTAGFVLTSSDGRVWNHQELGAKRLRVVQYGAGGFVIGGNDLAIFGSTDGISWTPSELGGGEGIDGLNFRSLVYGNGAWIGACNDGLVAYSPDGKSWALTSSGQGYNLRGAIPWRDRVILVGGRGRVLVSGSMFASLRLEIRDREPSLRVVRGFSARAAVEVSADILHWEPFVETSFEEEEEGRRYPLSPGLPAQFFRVSP